MYQPNSLFAVWTQEIVKHCICYITVTLVFVVIKYTLIKVPLLTIQVDMTVIQIRLYQNFVFMLSFITENTRKK